MELRHLRYFVAVAEDRSYSRAAKRLNIAQQALSKQVHDLEQELGVVLFERLPRGVQLTAVGETVLAEARATLRAATQTVTVAARARGELSGRLRVGVADIRALDRPLLRVMAEYAHHNRRMGVEPVRKPSAEQWEDLRHGRLDVAIVYGGNPSPGEFGSVALEQLPIDHAIVAADHPLAGRGRVALPELGPYPFVHFPRAVNPPLYDYVVDMLRARGVGSAIRAGTHMSAFTSLAISEPGTWRLVDRLSLIEARVAPHIAVLELADEPIPNCISLLWLRTNDAPAVAQFVEVARDLWHEHAEGGAEPPSVHGR